MPAPGPFSVILNCEEGVQNIPLAAKLELHVDRRLLTTSRRYGIADMSVVLKADFAAKLNAIQMYFTEQ